jgi:hypothetical protein
MRTESVGGIDLRQALAIVEPGSEHAVLVALHQALASGPDPFRAYMMMKSPELFTTYLPRAIDRGLYAMQAPRLVAFEAMLLWEREDTVGVVLRTLPFAPTDVRARVLAFSLADVVHPNREGHGISDMDTAYLIDLVYRAFRNLDPLAAALSGSPLSTRPEHYGEGTDDLGFSKKPIEPDELG